MGNEWLHNDGKGKVQSVWYCNKSNLSIEIVCDYYSNLSIEIVCDYYFIVVTVTTELNRLMNNRILIIIIIVVVIYRIDQ